MWRTLTKEQKESIGILQIGTFLEYFDLMLYIHMAVVLNDLFFPAKDTNAAKLISAFAFSSTFIFRPIGALIIGFIGDNFGRKPTVVITTMMMALSCLVMANLPTYAQIGIIASWTMIICRIIQGFSSMGEIIGAEIYVTEMIKAPLRYLVICLMDCAAGFGSLMALAIVSAVFFIHLDWRVVFWIGALIAIIGTTARSVLRETTDFVNAKHKIQNIIKELGRDPNIIQKNLILNKKVNPKISLAYFLVQCGTPLRFYFAYVYSSDLLKSLFNYSGEQIINHNLIVAIVDFISIIYYTVLSYKFPPLKVVKYTGLLFLIFILAVPYWLSNITSPFHLLIMQCICVFGVYDVPAHGIFFVHFPIFKRFTYSGFIFAFARAIMYSITAIGLVYITNIFSYWGIWIVFIPITIAFCLGVQYFESLENELGEYNSIKKYAIN